MILPWGIHAPVCTSCALLLFDPHTGFPHLPPYAGDDPRVQWEPTELPGEVRGVCTDGGAIDANMDRSMIDVFAVVHNIQACLLGDAGR